MCKPEWKYHCSQGLLAKLLFLFQFPGLGGFLRSIAITPLYFCVGLFGFFIVVCLQKLKVPNFRNSMEKFIGVLQTPVIWKTGPIKRLLSASDIWEDLSHPKYRKPPKLTVLRRTCCPEQMSRSWRGICRREWDVLEALQQQECLGLAHAPHLATARHPAALQPAGWPPWKCVAKILDITLWM